MLFLLFLIFSFVAPSTITLAVEAPPPYTVIEDRGIEEIATPSFKERKVLKIRLNNGLEAILVSDPLIAESGAALVVRTGSFEDGEETAGIAHFLEHMLFLGTKKYPEESGYQHFISQNGGMTNAFTTNDFTGFLFTVNHAAFKEALDRFSEFFKEPLFNPSGVSRELLAIDQEYAKNIENDQIRELYVMKELANEKHPYHAFGMGNKNSLSKVSRQELIDWYQKHYSANQMQLIVYSNLGLDDLKNLVVQDFSEVVNNNREPIKKSAINIQSESAKQKIVYIQPVKNLKNLTLIWYLPEKFAEALDEQPGTLVATLLGDEGDSSLLGELKREGLAETISAGSFKVGPGNQLFYLDLDLTTKGLKSLDLVIEKIYGALAFLKKSPLPSYIFEDYNSTAKLKIREQPRENLFQKLMKDAMFLGTEKTATFPLQSLIIQKFNPELTQELLNFLTPLNAEIYVFADPEISGISPTKKEQWLGARYEIRPLFKEQLEAFEKAKPFEGFSLPPKNRFIPKDLSLLNKLDPSKSNKFFVPTPTLLINNEQAKIYFAADTLFGTPKIYLNFEIKTPEIQAGIAESIVVADLYIKFLKEFLNPLAYEAESAGLNYSLDRTDNGLNLKVSGFNENAALLFQEITSHFKNNIDAKKFTEEKFLIFKESLFQDYQNMGKSSPLKIALELMKSALYKHYTNEDEKAEAIQILTFKDFQTKLTSLFKETYVEGLIFGNSIEKEALAISENLIKTLASKPYPKNQRLAKEVLVLPGNQGPFYLEKKVNMQGNALILIIEEKGFSLKKRAAQQILMNSLSSPFFSTLRTKQQTGYLVQSNDEELEKKLFNLFIIQSNTHEPQDLLGRVELFLETYLQEIGTLNLKEEDFETIKSALIDNIMTGYQKSEKMGELLKHLAFKYDGDFDWINKRILAFRELSYKEFLDFAQESIGKRNKRRLGLLIHGIIPEENRLNFIKLQTLKELRRVSSY